VIEELKKLGVKEIRVHDPLVASDPALPQDLVLTPSLAKAVQGADLVILVSDHPEYKSLKRQDLGGAPVYDGRGMLDGSRFAGGRFASIGRPS
jgi:UDP-N-acetyl-D-mannosaminuronate dehydrogenase